MEHKKSVLLTDLQYFIPVTFIKTLLSGSYVIFDPYVPHLRQSFRNRMCIAGANGIITLCIPLNKGRSQMTPYREVVITQSENWQLQHWKSIVSCYNRSPWFEYYRSDLEKLYQQRHTFLWDWNLSCWNWLMTKMPLHVKCQILDQPREFPKSGYIDYRNQFTPAGLKNQPANSVYTQVFMDRFGFLPHLSVLDLLFCEGPAASAKY